jgi:hypothetical protein
MKQIDASPLADMLSVEITPLSFKEKVESVRERYTQYALRDTDACGGQPDVADEIFYLKMLEERLMEIITKEQKTK